MRKRYRSWSSFSDTTIDYILTRMPDPLRPEHPSPVQRLGNGLVAISVIGLLGLLLACPLWLLLYGLGNASIFDSLAVWGTGFLWLVGLGLFLLGVGTQPKWRIILGLMLAGMLLIFGLFLLGGGDRFFQAFFCLLWGTTFWWHADSGDNRLDGTSSSRSAWVRRLALLITMTAYLFAVLLTLPTELVSATPWLAEVVTWRPATFLWMAHWLLIQLPGQRMANSAGTPANRAAQRITRERDEGSRSNQ